MGKMSKMLTASKMTYEEILNNLKEIQGIVTDWVPCYDPNNNWERYTITLNIASEAIKNMMNKEGE